MEVIGTGPVSLTIAGSTVKTLKKCTGTSGRWLKLTVVVGQLLSLCDPPKVVPENVVRLENQHSLVKHQSWIKDISASTWIFNYKAKQHFL